MVPGMPPPVNDALGTMLSGFAEGKNCWKPGRTSVRSLPSFAAWFSACVFWCDQFTPTVASEKVVELKVWSSVFTSPALRIEYLLGCCGHPPPDPSSDVTPPAYAS